MKKPFLFILLYLLVYSGFGQSSSFRLDRTIGIKLSSPRGIHTDRAGNVYVAEKQHVVKLSPYGQVLARIRVQDEISNNTIHGFGVDADGHMYVSVTDQGDIRKFNDTGQLLLKFGSTGQADGQFIRPSDIDVDASGNIYVTDVGNHCIQKFSSSGQFLQRIGSYGGGNGQFTMLRDICLDKDGNIFALGLPLQKLSPTGQFLMRIGGRGLWQWIFHTAL
jgi:tripartite motif-containing protein 71